MKRCSGKIASLVLALCLVLSSCGQAFAVTSSTVNVDSSNSPFVLQDDIDVVSSGSGAVDVAVFADDNTKIKVEIIGDLSAEDMSGNVAAIEVNHSNGVIPIQSNADIKIEVTGDLDVKGDYVVSGMDASMLMLEDSTVDIDIHGDITSSAESMESHGVRVDSLTGNDFDVDVDGKIDSKSDGWRSHGVYVYAGNEDDIDVSVGGGVESTTTEDVINDQYGIGNDELSWAIGIFTETYGAPVDVTVTGDVDVEGAASATGVTVWTHNENAETNIVIENGDLIVSAGGATVTNPDYSDSAQATGLNIHNGGGDVTVSIDGDIIVDGRDDNTTAIYVSSNDEFNHVWNQTGTTVQDQSKLERAVDYDGPYTFAEDTAIYESNIDGSWTYFDSDGNIYEQGSDSYENEGTTNIAVGGDVSSSDVGIYADVDDKQITDIVIDGTLYAENAAIVCVEDTVLGDNLLVTVWKIETGEDGDIVQSEDTTDSDPVLKEDLEAAKQIQYIIRLDQPTAGASVATDGTTISHGYDVAKQGDYVYLKVTLDDGYELVNAYNGVNNKVELLKDETTGDYYVIVPAGGGVSLSVEVKAIEEASDEPADDPAPVQPSPVSDPEPEAAVETAEPIATNEDAVPVNVVVAVAQVAAIPELDAVKLDDSEATIALKDIISDAVSSGDVRDIFPEEINALIPEDRTDVKEIFTASLIGVMTTDTYIWSFEGTAAYEQGEELTVVIALMNADGTYDYHVLSAKAGANGKIEVVFGSAMIQLLLNHSFTTIILGK